MRVRTVYQVDDTMVDAYLDRIGAARPDRPDTDTLRHLHQRHLATTPFENLDIHLGETITLDERALLDKIVTRRRGGFCYELNGAFALLLRALGFRVDLLAARVHSSTGFGPPFDHLALLVSTPQLWLADVGFGRHSTYPLRYDLREDQPDPDGSFHLVDAVDADVDVLRNGEPAYRAERRPRELTDFVPTCWWQQTAPTSHFTRSITCSLPTRHGRVTLSGNRLLRTENGRREETTLPDDAAILAAYREHFGVVLDRVPVDPR